MALQVVATDRGLAPLENGLAAAAEVDPDIASRASRALDVILAGTVTSPWQSVAWAASSLTQCGYPVELGVVSGRHELRYAADVVGPERPARRFARRRVHGVASRRRRRADRRCAVRCGRRAARGAGSPLRRPRRWPPRRSWRPVQALRRGPAEHAARGRARRAPVVDGGRADRAPRARPAPDARDRRRGRNGRGVLPDGGRELRRRPCSCCGERRSPTGQTISSRSSRRQPSGADARRSNA